ncbi:hypothetical protein FOG18_13665 (plasmid) [Legionella israelensis]|uniref:SIR2 family protein n=1 Tax=Legionella israelensis TaxID=454 RepID=UPI00117C5308|nr:SIR2 family protein [Legionella israelensis]QDP73703.1 hypothetical protein FOG18_13665 [Legionella israelensis]
MASNDNSIAYIIGAGASYGHSDQHKYNPPVMSNFISRSVEEGFLKEEDYPALISYIKNGNQSVNLLDKCREIETNFNLETFLEKIDDIWVLHEALFYINNYLGKFCAQKAPLNSAYNTLASYVKKNKNKVSGIINLNYDTFFENALITQGIGIYYGFGDQSPNDLFYLKLHGSLNFRINIGRMIRMSCASWSEYIKKKNSYYFSNEFSGNIEVFEPAYDFASDFCSGGLMSFFPCIIPPLGAKKHYSQLPQYNSLWDNAKQVLVNSSDVVIIGCALNEEDKKLWGLIRDMGRNKNVYVVSGCLSESEKVAKMLNEIRFKEIKPIKVQGFLEYVNTCLTT